MYGTATVEPSALIKRVVCPPCLADNTSDSDDSSAREGNENEMYPYLCLECGKGFFIDDEHEHHSSQCSYHSTASYVTPRPVMPFQDPNDYSTQ